MNMSRVLTHQFQHILYFPVSVSNWDWKILKLATPLLITDIFLGHFLATVKEISESLKDIKSAHISIWQSHTSHWAHLRPSCSSWDGHVYSYKLIYFFWRLLIEDYKNKALQIQYKLHRAAVKLYRWKWCWRPVWSCEARCSYSSQSSFDSHKPCYLSPSPHNPLLDQVYPSPSNSVDCI